MKKLILIRHGESCGNVIFMNSFMNQDDSFHTDEFRSTQSDKWKLTEDGKNQAKSIKKYLHQNHAVDYLFHSPIKRAEETALILYPDRMWTVNSLLSERNYGGLELQTWSDWVKIQKSLGRSEHDTGMDWRPADGESTFEVIKRSIQFLDYLRSEIPKGSTALAVSHGDFIQATRFHLRNMSKKSYHIFKNLTPGNHVRYCQIFILEFDDNGLFKNEESFFTEGKTLYTGSIINGEFLKKPVV